MNKYVFAILLVLIWSCTVETNDQFRDPTMDGWAFPYFSKVDSLNPILKPSADLTFNDPITNTSVKWEKRNVLNPTAMVKNGKVHLLYRAQDSHGTSRIGLAVSEDGLNFTKRTEPIFYPDNDSMKTYEWNYQKLTRQSSYLNKNITLFDGVEDPRVVQDNNGRYIMTYTSYDGKTARLSIASSSDLKNWTKHGLAFNKKYHELWSKAGAIVCRLEGNKLTTEKINGQYWMYFGDTNIFLATSDDLINWTIVENIESKKPIAVLNPRPGYFDSRLVEPGPYALVRDQGILLIYNSSNAKNNNDPDLPKFTYAAGQALFDKNIPYKLLKRTKNYFIYPDKPYEKIGEVNEVCFVEGLVHFKEKWFLYYGTADSKISVAVYNEKF